MLRWSDQRPEPEQLYWALTAVPAAAAARDYEVLDDLLTEIRMWLDRLWRALPRLSEATWPTFCPSAPSCGPRRNAAAAPRTWTRFGFTPGCSAISPGPSSPRPDPPG